MAECTDQLKRLRAEIATLRAALDQAFEQQPDNSPLVKTRPKGPMPMWGQGKTRG